jgi:hypothetical protein
MKSLLRPLSLTAALVLTAVLTTTSPAGASCPGAGVCHTVCQSAAGFAYVNWSATYLACCSVNNPCPPGYDPQYSTYNNCSQGFQECGL